MEILCLLYIVFLAISNIEHVEGCFWLAEKSLISILILDGCR